MHNIVSSHHKIKINDPIKPGDENEDDVNPGLMAEDKRVEFEARKNQMTVREDKIKEDFVYIEKFKQSTFQSKVFMDEKDPNYGEHG